MISSMTKVRQWWRSVGLAWLLAGTALSRAAGQDDVELRPRFEPGAVRYLEDVRETQQRMWASENLAASRERQTRQVFGLWQKVESVDADRGADLLLTIDRLSIAQTGGGQDTSFDTDTDDLKDDTDPVGRVFRAMLGAELTVGVDRNLRVTTFAGFNDLFARMEAERKGERFFEQLRATLTDATGRFMWVEGLLVPYPSGRVHPGDTWAREVRVASRPLGDQIYAYECRLADIRREKDRSVAIINFTGTMRQAPDAGAGQEVFGTHMELDSGSFQGTVTIDVATGLLVRMESESDVVVISEIPSQGEGEPVRLSIETKGIRTVTMMSEGQRRAQTKSRLPEQPAPSDDASPTNDAPGTKAPPSALDN